MNDAMEIAISSSPQNYCRLAEVRKSTLSTQCARAFRAVQLNPASHVLNALKAF